MRRATRYAVVVLSGLLPATIRADATDAATASASGHVRFLVAEIGEVVHGDSYVLPLSDPESIAHARKLIELGPAAGRTIVSAWVAPGANGINRDYLAPGAPMWHWHVTGLREFTDFTAEIFDGWPTFVNDDVEGWIRNTEGQIGFWDYSVVAELPIGDYDADLDVDADDYVVWRAGFGSTSDLSADGSGNGVVDAADYALWRRNLGTKINLPRRPAGTMIAVPEPAMLGIAPAAAASTVMLRRRSAPPQTAFRRRLDGRFKAKLVDASCRLGRARVGRGWVGPGFG